MPDQATKTVTAMVIDKTIVTARIPDSVQTPIGPRPPLTQPSQTSGSDYKTWYWI
ncbi:hypothetical protein BX600DRAFT_452177 [Xylariales sp. PMI_506]|nr:hypothetical protein BX600DRAFT_452177 [Xylariales sp. PMI_506]